MCLKLRYYASSVSIFILLAIFLTSAFHLDVIAQTNGTPVPLDRGPLFVADGVSSSVIARSEVEVHSFDHPRLILERIVIPAGTQMPERTTASPELIYVEEGAISYTDPFGFTISANAGESRSFEENATYTLEVPGSSTTRFYRLSLTPVEAETSATLDPSTMESTLVATPVVHEIRVETLIDRQVEDFPPRLSTLFIGKVTLSPGAETGEQQHDGPLGIYVERGTITVMTPSGSEGQLAAGASAVLPANVPLIASNNDTEDISAILIGVVEPNGSLFSLANPTEGSVGGRACWSENDIAARNEDGIPIQWDTPPDQVIDTDADYLAVLKTSKGTITLELLSEAAPVTVNNFVCLAQAGYYDGTPFHRVLEGFVI